jgi:Zn-dependent M16 (insulinase) family peptidase
MRSKLASVFLVVSILLFSLVGGSRVVAQSGSLTLESLSEGKIVNGFKVISQYLNDADEPMGGRFLHLKTGFTLDLLQLQSVPQGFIWVNTFPTSDKGEPHTQEHLLLGKGNKGRYMSGLEGMSLAGSSAFTMQWRTCYHFHTAAGSEVFYRLFENQMDALLHPDYTDEEIRREVRNFGIAEDPATRTLRLEEQGSVYNEMVSTYERPITRLFRSLNIVLYGKDHPLSYDSGGAPEAIREMKPEDIRRFHREHYFLGNMGMIGSFPEEISPENILRRMDEILNSLEGEEDRKQRPPIMTESQLPVPKITDPGLIKIVNFPNKNEQQPGYMVFSWPAQLKLDSKEELLLGLFISNVAGDATTNLYKIFIDTKTRQMDIGARGVFGGASEDLGHPVYVGLTDVAPVHMEEEKIKAIRQKVVDEIARIASWKDGSPELEEFNARIRSRVIETKRGLSKFVNSPPGFGFRSSSSGWLTHLHRLSRSNDFKKFVTMKGELALLERLLAGKENFWRRYINEWKLTDAPYALSSRANSEMLARDEKERQERIQTELARLKAKYNVTEDQEAIRLYKRDYDAAKALIDEEAKKVTPTRFVDSPPLTLDDQLNYSVTTLQGGINMVASTFENMTSATTGIALRLDGVPESELFYLSILPSLMTRVGVIDKGRPISYEEMSEMLRKEVLGLNAYFSNNFRTGRCELVIRGSGNDLAESKRAIEWMKLVMESPDWRPENLPRIRDLVDQQLGGLRNTMQGAEEGWVHNPARAYLRQDNPLLLVTDSFLTRTHNVQRLRWMLKDALEPETREGISNFLDKLGAAGGEAGRADLVLMLGAVKGDPSVQEKVPEKLKSYFDYFNHLPMGAKELAIEAAKDLEQNLTGIPDSSLAEDWVYLCRQMKNDLLLSPQEALTNLNTLRRRIMKTVNARMFIIASSSNQKGLDGKIQELIEALDRSQPARVTYSTTPLIRSRLSGRVKDSKDPVFVGLINPNTRGGVFLNSAKGITFNDTDRESLLQFLAFKLYGGAGAHGIFIKTIGAGLAYSNGLGGSPAAGRISYYAERTPELPQTIRFVIDELKNAPRDPNLGEYVIAQVFNEFRSASGYEGRGEAMAADLADGVTPEMVSRFRKAVLELRNMPNLVDELYKRMETVYARVLPGYRMKAKDVPEGVFFVIGPERQFDLYESYLKSVEGQDTRLYRLYPRDFWMTF